MSSPDHLRIGDAERDAVTSALHDHFALGRLTRDELDERLDTTLAAKTRADLREIVHDLPEPNGLPAAVEPVKTGHPHHRHRHGPPFMPVLLILFIVALATGGLGGALVIAKVFFLFWLVTTLFFMLRFRHHRRQEWHRSRH